MSIASHEDGKILVEKLFSAVGTSNRNAHHHGLNKMMYFIVREASSTLSSAKELWSEKGLFVSNSDLDHDKPYTVIVYKMACGALLGIVLSNMPKVDGVVDVVFRGDKGIKIPFQYWHPIANINEYIVKKGEHNYAHLANRPDEFQV